MWPLTLEFCRCQDKFQHSSKRFFGNKFGHNFLERAEFCQCFTSANVLSKLNLQLLLSKTVLL